MTYLLAVLRLIHIVAAVAWVGMGVTLMFFVAPAAASAGESGVRFMKSLYANTKFVMAFPATAGITMLAGLLMYIPFIGGGRSFSTTGQIVLGIGALAGIAAGIHGGAVTGRATRAYYEALNKYVTDGQAIAADGLATLRELGMKVGSHTRVSFIMMVVALIFMAGARYL